MRADRLLSEVALLRTHGRLSAAELARRVEASPRTVMRDMEALSAAGVPVYAERGRTGGFSLLPGYRPPAEDLTADEAKALFVAGGAGVADALGMGSSFASALRKLTAGLPDRQAGAVGEIASRIVIDPTGWGGAAAPPPLLSTVLDAVLSDRRLLIGYRSPSSGTAGHRTVDPWGLVLAGTAWYLLGAHRGRPRSYRLTRMTSARRIDQPCRKPANLDLLAQWRDRQAVWRAARPGHRITVRVVAKQSDPLVQLLGIALVAPPRVAPDGDGHDLVTAQVSTLRGAVGVMLGFGDWLEVLEPPELRELMRSTAETVSRTYRRRGS
ncbi:helix-turn-helix transcriptional regulator [Nakamurella aerolata]|uniref:YafY family transcriptional regulator n=1 Tax=Nakamurella aerolata TaxID=1656892 RepID=A0A849A4F2_9ACTN|nr:YafY family protein [Nakamurella aerolata]NNG35469.1 YafY family transcriptional regulator [Nakamurella aerolata]